MLGKAEVMGVGVPVITQLQFQQSFLFMMLEVPQTPFIDRLSEIPVAPQSGYSQCKLCRNQRFHRCTVSRVTSL